MPAAPTTPPPRLFRDEAHQKRPSRIAGMFDRIAPTYDFLNHLLSANVDRAWRRRAVDLLALEGAERVLDVCTGTGDLAVALLEGGAGRVEGCDFAPAMIDLARKKAGDRVRFRVADALALPYGDGAFDVVTVAFGVRNFHDLDRGLGEMARVVRPGGRLLVLEFSRPTSPVVRGLYETYAMLVLPLIGSVVSGGGENAYAYLPRSVRAFPGPRELAGRLRGAGFRTVRIHRLTGGIAALHLATR
ncbi:MAG: bifunctional demethylmenaquinone methyltransferase/2-methoxy-6-polyprenyl-1,4-benzoquinol methylase UbiE [Planctomycetota bacterium]